MTKVSFGHPETFLEMRLEKIDPESASLKLFTADGRDVTRSVLSVGKSYDSGLEMVDGKFLSVRKSTITLSLTFAADMVKVDQDV